MIYLIYLSDGLNGLDRMDVHIGRGWSGYRAGCTYRLLFFYLLLCQGSVAFFVYASCVRRDAVRGNQFMWDQQQPLVFFLCAEYFRFRLVVSASCPALPPPPSPAVSSSSFSTPPPPSSSFFQTGILFLNSYFSTLVYYIYVMLMQPPKKKIPSTF